VSTSYYRLAPPITHLEVKDDGDHKIIGIWMRGEKVGELRVPECEVKRFAHLLYEWEDDVKCPLRTYWNGKESVVIVNDPEMPDDAVVISEYGDILTVGKVKTRQGAKRSDGWPTELFGYED